MLKAIASIIRPIDCNNPPSSVFGDFLRNGVAVEPGLEVMDTAINEGLTIIDLSPFLRHIHELFLGEERSIFNRQTVLDKLTEKICILPVGIQGSFTDIGHKVCLTDVMVHLGTFDRPCKDTWEFRLQVMLEEL